MRPLGVTILALLMLVGGVVFFASGLSLIISKDVAYPIFVEEYGRMLNESMNISGIKADEIIPVLYDTASYIAVLFGSLYILIGMGLFFLKEWARIGAVLISGFNVLYGIFLAFVLPSALVDILLNLLVIWYLMKPDIREKFTRKMSIEERILGELDDHNS